MKTEVVIEMSGFMMQWKRIGKYVETPTPQTFREPLRSGHRQQFVFDFASNPGNTQILLKRPSYSLETVLISERRDFLTELHNGDSFYSARGYISDQEPAKGYPQVMKFTQQPRTIDSRTRLN